MTQLGRTLIYIIVGLFFFVWVGQITEVISSPDSLHIRNRINIARGKKYILEPAPNYELCTDPGDVYQLTDGKYKKSGAFWTKKNTVGWSGAHPAVITIDLKSVQPIRGVSYNTAAGVAGVYWPEAICILVSDGGKEFFFVDDLVELDSEHCQHKEYGTYDIHRFWTDELKISGRFVKLLIPKIGSYTFVDEIEIFGEPDSFAREDQNSRAIQNLGEFHKEFQVTIGVRRRLRQDLKMVRNEVKKLTNVDSRIKLLEQLETIDQEVAERALGPWELKTTIFPINELHERIFKVQAALWRTKFREPLVVWQKNRWDMISPTEAPVEGETKIDASMMIGEFRSAAFNLSNTTDSIVRLRIRIEGLPGGLNPGYIKVHEVPFTDTKSGVPVAAALPYATRVADDYRLEILPGMTRQVWLTFHPTHIRSGEYHGKIVIDEGQINIPTHLKIYPFIFPKRPTLHLGGWDYTNRDSMYDVTKENRDLLIEHLQEHFVDTPWATTSVMPLGKYDPDGAMIGPPSHKNFKLWLERWPDARNYYVFLNLQKRFAGFQIGTPPFKRAVANWINWWVNRLESWKIASNRLGLLLLDEPNTHEKDKIVIAYAGIIQEAQPEVVIWENPRWRKPWEALPEMFEICDVLSPSYPMWIEQGKPFADFYIKKRDAGRNLWFYSSLGPGKLLDPYSYHRMQQWLCWKYDASGSCFWAFGDSSGASSWNEYVSTIGAYTPVFLDPLTVTPGKHMEAIREGIEDYEYLRMLRDRIDGAERIKGKKDQTIASARKLLETAADRVIACLTEKAKLKWQEPKDRSVANIVRLEILNMLQDLQKIK